MLTAQLQKILVRLYYITEAGPLGGRHGELWLSAQK